MDIDRTRDEIDAQIDATGDAGIGMGASKWPGMTYEQGVSAALRWVTGDDDTAPMDED